MSNDQSIKPGLYIFIAAFIALVVCNIGFDQYYDQLFSQILINHEKHPITTLFIINEVLMVLFFFSVTLEIKYEYLFGVLKDPSTRLLPALCAIGGMVVPALIYFAFERGEYIAGWAIPVATDIAFSLAALILVGRMLPPSIRIFLLSLAIFDDIGAIAIIAAYFSDGLTFHVLAALVAILLYLYLVSSVSKQVLYYLIGIIALWYICFLGGVHTTIAGVILALFIPMRNDIGLFAQKMNHMIQPFVLYFILPLFAFANAGFAFHDVMHVFDLPFAYGIFFGLTIGKPLGIGLLGYLLVSSSLCKYPQGMSHMHLFAVAFLCGIGFTMSLFIALLAFDKPDILDVARLAILAASLVSAGIGMFKLHYLSSVEMQRIRGT